MQPSKPNACSRSRPGDRGPNAAEMPSGRELGGSCGVMQRGYKRPGTQAGKQRAGVTFHPHPQSRFPDKRLSWKNKSRHGRSLQQVP